MRRFILLILIVFVLTIPVRAHPGGTDGNGGHYDHSTGEYHYHHGYGAHDHEDLDGDGVLDCPHNFKDKTGERQADFVNVIAWRATAEFVSKFFSKGRMAIVEGKLQSRNYEDKDGNKRYALEVIADNVYFGDSKKDQAAEKEPEFQPPQFTEYQDDDGDLPF